MTFRVKSTKDTGGHRDCCVFFNHQNETNFYYVHLGANPDPHSGQIMIVKDAPRKAITVNKNKTPWDDEWHNVKLVRNSRKTLECNDQIFRQIVKASFNQRRKTLRNALKSFSLEKELETADLLQKRAEELSVEDFITITLACQEKSK